MASAGTAYVQIAFDPNSTKRMADDMARSLRRLADYLDAYADDAEADEADE
jgi:hypothetical protein